MIYLKINSSKTILLTIGAMKPRLLVRIICKGDDNDQLQGIGLNKHR